MIVRTKAHFDSAHWLPNYKGKCCKVHGHRWVVEVKVQGEVGEDAILWDFSNLKKAVDKLDHKMLNDFVKIPTAENLVLYFGRKLKKKGCCMTVRVYESPDSYAEDVFYES